MIRPRRSMLFIPGSSARAHEKARGLPVDGIIFDLEDSVAPEAKAAARQQITQTMQTGGYGRREILIRINGRGSPYWADDVAAAVKAGPDGVLMPKMSSVEDLAAIAQALTEAGAPPAMRVWGMIETALGVLRVSDIAACAGDDAMRLAGLVIGPNDIMRETQMRSVPGRVPMLPLLTQCLVAARAYGLAILDGVYNDFSDNAGFAAECAQGRDMGFDGKTLIHPSQIGSCNEAFSPSAEDVARARQIIALYELPENAGKSAVKMDGQMVERLHAEMAQRVVAIADAVGEL